MVPIQPTHEKCSRPPGQVPISPNQLPAETKIAPKNESASVHCMRVAMFIPKSVSAKANSAFSILYMCP
jgi:hypothetical protein